MVVLLTYIDFKALMHWLFIAFHTNQWIWLILMLPLLLKRGVNKKGAWNVFDTKLLFTMFGNGQGRPKQ